MQIFKLLALVLYILEELLEILPVEKLKVLLYGNKNKMTLD